MNETFKEFIDNMNPESLEKTRKRMEEEIRKEEEWQKALDDAARECCKEEINGETRYYPAIEYYFKAGAKWQKEHMDK